MTEEIRPGFDVLARDGSLAGTVAEVTESELIVRRADGGAEPLTVPRNLVVETTGGRVFVDVAPEDLGLAGHGADRGTPSEGPGGPPEVTTPEHIRRLSGG